MVAQKPCRAKSCVSGGVRARTPKAAPCYLAHTLSRRLLEARVCFTLKHKFVLPSPQEQCSHMFAKTPPHPNLRRVDHRLWPRSPFSKIEPRPRSSQPCLPSTCSQHPTPAQICEGSTTAYGPGRLSPKLSPAPAKSSLPSVVYIILVAHLLQSCHHRRHHEHALHIHLFSYTHALTRSQSSLRLTS